MSIPARYQGNVANKFRPVFRYMTFTRYARAQPIMRLETNPHGTIGKGGSRWQSLFRRLFAFSTAERRGVIVFRLSIATLLVAVSCVFADAEVPASPPKDVPPVIGTAVATPSSAEGDDDKWSIKLVVPKVAWEVIGEERPKLEWPKFNVTVEEATLTLQMAYHRATQLSDNAQNRLLDLKGRRLRRDEALKRLAAKTPVLVSVSGKMPDPFYLQCTKPDTLIVVLGIPVLSGTGIAPVPKADSIGRQELEASTEAFDEGLGTLRLARRWCHLLLPDGWHEQD